MHSHMKKYQFPIFSKTDSSIRFGDNNQTDFFLHKALIPIIMALLFAVLLIRLFQLTIVKGSYYDTLANKNRIKEIIIEAPRGIL
ncbi:MAG: hypothetical protein ACMG6E_02670, partial [Candidatus Roizmanbacteria bacterium]